MRMGKDEWGWVIINKHENWWMIKAEWVLS